MYFHFIIHLSVYFCREHLRTAQHSTPGSALVANWWRGNHWENITLPYTRRDAGGFLGVYLAFTIQNLWPPPLHWAKPFLQDLSWGGDSCRAFSFIFWAKRWNCKSLVAKRLKCFHQWWQGHHSILHLRDLRGLFQPYRFYESSCISQLPKNVAWISHIIATGFKLHAWDLMPPLLLTKLQRVSLISYAGFSPKMKMLSKSNFFFFKLTQSLEKNSYLTAAVEWVWCFNFRIVITTAIQWYDASCWDEFPKAGFPTTNRSFLLWRGLASNNQPVFTLCPHSDAWQPLKKFHSETRHWLI